MNFCVCISSQTQQCHWLLSTACLALHASIPDGGPGLCVIGKGDGLPQLLPHPGFLFGFCTLGMQATEMPEWSFWGHTHVGLLPLFAVPSGMHAAPVTSRLSRPGIPTHPPPLKDFGKANRFPILNLFHQSRVFPPCVCPKLRGLPEDDGHPEDGP
jgi:hypothetical protein